MRKPSLQSGRKSKLVEDRYKSCMLSQSSRAHNETKQTKAKNHPKQNKKKHKNTQNQKQNQHRAKTWHQLMGEKDGLMQEVIA